MYVLDFLGSRGVWFEALLHRPASSSAKRAGNVHVPGRRVAKAVLIKAGDSFVLAVLPSTSRIDLGQLSEVVGAPASRCSPRDPGRAVRDFPRLRAGSGSTVRAALRADDARRFWPGGIDRHRARGQHSPRGTADALHRLSGARTAHSGVLHSANRAEHQPWCVRPSRWKPPRRVGGESTRASMCHFAAPKTCCWRIVGRAIGFISSTSSAEQQHRRGEQMPQAGSSSIPGACERRPYGPCRP